MPLNKIGKNKDDFATYSVIKNHVQKKITQRKNESKKDFVKRCNDLDGTNLAADKMTFAEAYGNWIENHIKPDCSRAYLDQCDTLYKNHIKAPMGFRRLTEALPEDVTRVLMQMKQAGLSDWTMKHARKIISGVYNFTAEQKGWTDIVSPTTKVKIPSSKRYSNNDAIDELDDEGVRFVTSDEMDRLRKAMSSSHYKYAFELYPLIGARRGELIGLKWDDIADGFIRIRRSNTKYGMSTTKTRQGMRFIPTTETVLQTLCMQKLHLFRNKIKSDYVFPNTHGKRTTASGIKTAFDRARKQTTVWQDVKAGNGAKKHGDILVKPVDFSIQDFRHTFGTLAAPHMSPHVLADIMGHKSINTTMRYYVGLPSEQLAYARDGMSKMNFDKVSQRL